MRKGVILVSIALTLLFTVMSGSQCPTSAQGQIRDRLTQRFAQRNTANSSSYSSYKIAGLDVLVWEANQTALTPRPLVIFSHGFAGMNRQSISITQAIANAGYLVIAPNHKDAMGSDLELTKPEVSFNLPKDWNERTCQHRLDDMRRLVYALRADPHWSHKIDWSKVALAGHSLGGYTALACGGGWNSWKIPGISAVLALSPYCQPLVLHGELNRMVPVMYQTGTRDFTIAPFITKKGGAFEKTSSPAYLVVFDDAGHFAWTNLQQDEQKKACINYYCVAFLDKYVKRDMNAKPEKKLSGVTELLFH